MARITRAAMERAQRKVAETEERYAAIMANYEAARPSMDLAPKLPGHCQLEQRVRMTPVARGPEVDAILTAAEAQGFLVLPYRPGVRGKALREAWYGLCLRRRAPFIVVQIRPDGYGHVNWSATTMGEGARERSAGVLDDLEAVYCRIELDPDTARRYRQKLRTDSCYCGGEEGAIAHFPAEHQEIVFIIVQRISNPGAAARAEEARAA